MLVYLIFLVIQLILGFFIFYLCLAFITGAPFVPTTNQVAKHMIKLAQIKPCQTIYDLGSGDGRLLFMAARLGAKAYGLEINPYLVIYTMIKKLLIRENHHIHVLWKNFWKANISNADVVFIYLLPWRMEKLKQKLISELKSGSLVVSNSFIFPDWNVLRSDEKAHVYVFRIPEKTI